MLVEIHNHHFDVIGRMVYNFSQMACAPISLRLQTLSITNSFYDGFRSQVDGRFSSSVSFAVTDLESGGSVRLMNTTLRNLLYNGSDVIWLTQGKQYSLMVSTLSVRALYLVGSRLIVTSARWLMQGVMVSESAVKNGGLFEVVNTFPAQLTTKDVSVVRCNFTQSFILATNGNTEVSESRDHYSLDQEQWRVPYSQIGWEQFNHWFEMQAWNISGNSFLAVGVVIRLTQTCAVLDLLLHDNVWGFLARQVSFITLTARFR